MISLISRMGLISRLLIICSDNFYHSLVLSEAVILALLRQTTLTYSMKVKVDHLNRTLLHHMVRSPLSFLFIANSCLIKVGDQTIFKGCSILVG